MGITNIASRDVSKETLISFGFLFVLFLLAGGFMGCEAYDNIVNATHPNQNTNTYVNPGNQVAGSNMPGMAGGQGMHGFTMALFQATFYHGGYNLDVEENYEPGDYTKWDAEGKQHGTYFERALLKRKQDGSEWWRVKSIQEGDNGEQHEYVAEALLGPPNDAGQRQIRRLRTRNPNQEQAEEVPITKQQAEKWVVSNQQELTKESLQGMKVGIETVTTPAGTFKTDHLRASSHMGAGHVDWWLSDRVPGEVVKYTFTNAQDGTEYTVELTEYGSDATTSELGVFN